MSQTKKTIIKYSVGTLVALAIFLLVISLRDIYVVKEKKEIYRILSDGFTYPGIIFLCGGFLVFVSNRGIFNGIGYALKWFFIKLIPFSKKEHETYGDYLEKRKFVKSYYFLYIIGGVFLIMAIIFIILFYTTN